MTYNDPTNIKILIGHIENVLHDMSQDNSQRKYVERAIESLKGLFEHAPQLFENKSISIPLTENDLHELQAGDTFDWTFDGVDVHLYKDDNDDDE